jgi:hypothetical protein
MLVMQEDGKLRSYGFALRRHRSSPSGDWVALTPAGFFSASPGGANMLSIVRGLDEVVSGAQFSDHLYRPDLVVEALRRDPEGRYEGEAQKLNLEALLDSGPAPQIELLSTERATDTIRVWARIVDTGGGIGRVIWRVNGMIQADTAQNIPGASAPERYVVISAALNVDPARKNEIEITAYNASGLLATPPHRVAIDAFGVTTQERPRMFVLAIAIDNYQDPRYRLRYSVSDAQTIAEALTVAGRNLFASVQTTILTDEKVTEAGIEDAFSRIAAEAKVGDVFTLFLSGHSQSIEGSYYYFLQTLDLREGQTVEKHAISPNKWLAWLAKIAAQKRLAIVDTPQSGSLLSTSMSQSARSLERLQYATGVNLIAASNGVALEGYQGHGVLTSALLEALQKKDSDQPITVTDLGRYVDLRAGDHAATLRDLSEALNQAVR